MTPLLAVDGLSVVYPARGGAPAITALDAISLTIEAGETLGLAGASGSGKSTLARAILGLVPEAAGSVRICGAEVIGADAARLRHIRTRAQMVFQDTGDALDPRWRIGASIAEPLRAHGVARGTALTEIVSRLLVSVGLSAADADLYPAQLSGGQRQRVGIARALALDPALVVWDEAVSSLDVSIRAQVLNLLLDIRRARGLASLFIAHDLAVLRHVADRIAILEAGKLVEIGPCDTIFAHPAHPATRRLLAAMPAALQPAILAEAPEQDGAG